MKLVKKELTFTNLITILGIIIIPLIIWGKNVETRLEHVLVNAEQIIEIKRELKDIKDTTQENHEELIDLLHKIELQLKDKEDRN